MIRNYMEELVGKILVDLLKNNKDYADVCTCDYCIDDIMAKALNNIKPFYITGKKGEIYGEYYTRANHNNTKIIMEVVKAIEFIRDNKSHDDSKDKKRA